MGQCPKVVYSLPLQGDYQDSIYTVTVKYPEYVDMPATDISHYNRLSGAALPEQVAICQQVTECRKQGLLVISFSPLVFREHRYQALVKITGRSGLDNVPCSDLLCSV